MLLPHGLGQTPFHALCPIPAQHVAHHDSGFAVAVDCGTFVDCGRCCRLVVGRKWLDRAAWALAGAGGEVGEWDRDRGPGRRVRVLLQLHTRCCKPSVMVLRRASVHRICYRTLRTGKLRAGAPPVVAVVERRTHCRTRQAGGRGFEVRHSPLRRDDTWGVAGASKEERSDE